MENEMTTTISSGIAAGHCDTWEELRAVQQQHAVDDIGVIVDSGFGAKSDAEVYRQCARFCEFEPQGQGQRPLAMGWMPAKGMPTRKRWRDDSGLWLPYYLRTIDPYSGTADAGQVEMSLFEFSGDFFKDLLDGMRDPKRAQDTGVTWTVHASMATDEYWQHMDAEIKTAVRNKRTGKTVWEWHPRSQRWPNHLLDCEVMQVAIALFYGLLTAQPEEETHGRDNP